MSFTTPTLLPQSPKFPRLLPKPPQPHPVPKPKHLRVYGHFNAVRDLQREQDDLSAEELEFEQTTKALIERGTAFLVPIGKLLTQKEEKNDDSDHEEGEEEDSGEERPPSIIEDDEENESEQEQDLDASMEDLDEEHSGDIEDNADMVEGDTEDLEDDSIDI
ncbi:hypothetical protein BDN72DRAFT_891336 [Pluteus cervinus]|uniref:Uncharacterized protein n=1 Tax=Pluteus cervinus TaxID=181527 RepID=A0ACD3BEL2_9AGAR|nr:hypothetical protein BDN72DRAFT_891336 [Pluteus cervinus]